MSNLKISGLFRLGVSLLVLTTCSTSNPAGNEKEGARANIDEGFADFQKKFYEDTLFQSSRIKLPLGGSLKYWDEVNDTLIVSEKWELHSLTRISSKETLLIYYSELKSSLINEDTVFIEKYWIENSGFSIERRFKKDSGKWFLFYYDLFNL